MFWKPKKDTAPVESDQNAFIKHLSGKEVHRTSGGAARSYDPEVKLYNNILEIEGDSDQGTEIDFDSALLAATQYRQDIHRLVTSYEKYSGKNIQRVWRIIERKRSATAAAAHYHRPSLVGKHQEAAEKSITFNLESGAIINDQQSFDLTLRRLMYGVENSTNVVDDPAAASAYKVFKKGIDDATVSSDPIEAVIIANQIANYYDWIKLENEKRLYKIAKDQTPTGKSVESWWDLPPETKKVVISKVLRDAEKAAPKDQESGKTTFVELVEEAEVEIEDEVCNLGSREESEKQISKGLASAYGSTSAGNASIESGGGFQKRDTSSREIVTNLDYIRAKFVQEQQEAGTINTGNSYGVHDVDQIIPVIWKNKVKLLEPLITTDVMRMLLSSTRDSLGVEKGRVGFPTSDSWKIMLGKARVFRHPPDTQGSVAVMVDMSGSMGCGCYECFPHDLPDIYPCSYQQAHRLNNPKNNLKPTAKKNPIHYLHTIEGKCKPDEYNNHGMSTAAIAREIVGAISKRFQQVKVYGFSTGGMRTGVQIQEFPKGLWPTHAGFLMWGGGTPTCAAMNFMSDALAGSLQKTAAVLIADGFPGTGGQFKKSSPIKHCDDNHYRYLAETFAKRGMRFGLISVGGSAFPANLPKSVHVQIRDKSNKEMNQLIPLFAHIGAR